MANKNSTQTQFFRVTDDVPEEAWYWAAVGSILLSAGFKLAKKDHMALFIGQWPPTFIAFALYHKLLRPGGK